MSVRRSGAIRCSIRMVANQNLRGSVGVTAEALAEALPEQYAYQTDASRRALANYIIENLARLAPAAAEPAECNCATFGNASSCPIHTQADYEAGRAAAEPADEALRLLRDLVLALSAPIPTRGLLAIELGRSRAYLAAHPAPEEKR